MSSPLSFYQSLQDQYGFIEEGVRPLDQKAALGRFLLVYTEVKGGASRVLSLTRDELAQVNEHVNSHTYTVLSVYDLLSRERYKPVPLVQLVRDESNQTDAFNRHTAGSWMSA